MVQDASAARALVAGQRVNTVDLALLVGFDQLCMLGAGGAHVIEECDDMQHVWWCVWCCMQSTMHLAGVLGCCAATWHASPLT
jgi:hypothetical protein